MIFFIYFVKHMILYIEDVLISYALQVHALQVHDKILNHNNQNCYIK